MFNDLGRLEIENIFIPEQCEIKSKIGDELLMHYTGRFEDGTEFDSSVDRGRPFKFTLGGGEVIKGWNEGLFNMCIGEKRKLIIPPHLGFGTEGLNAVIPPDSSLHMDFELIDIFEKNDLNEDNEQLENLFFKLDFNQDGLLSQDEFSSYIEPYIRAISDVDEDEFEINAKVKKIIKILFDDLDNNSDNHLSPQEYYQNDYKLIKKDFVNLDVSNFIKESQSEIQDQDVVSEREHNEIISDIFSQEDVNKDGYISSEEFNFLEHDEF